MIYLKNISAALILLVSIVTLSIDASSKKNPPTKTPSQPKPKYVIPSKPGPIKFVPAGPGDRVHPRPPRGKR